MNVMTSSDATPLGHFPFSEKLVESLQFGIVFQDPTGSIVSANPSAERILGLSLDQMRGLRSVDPYWNAVHEDGSPFPGDQHPAMVALATRRPVLDVKMGVRDAAGASRRWINIRAFPVIDQPTQTTRGVHAIFEDVTQTMLLLESEKASEIRFRTLFETMSEGMALHELVLDTQGKALDYRILDVNPAFVNQTGMAQERVLGKLATEVYGLDRAPFLELYASVAITGQPISFEQYFEPLKRHFLIQVFSPKPRQFATVFSDITERMAFEQTLKKSQSFVTSVVNSLTEHVAVIDGNGVIISVNASWDKFAAGNGAAASSSVAVGANYLQVCTNATGSAQAEDGAAAIQGILSVLRGEAREFTLEYPCNSPTEKRWFELHVVPLLGAGGGAVLIHKNITDRKHAAYQIEHLAFYDPLTQLPNRRLMLDRLNQAIINNHRYRRCGAVLMLDLDNFKTINDTLGHDMGDKLLIEVASRLQSCMREGDTVSRLGGDEFVVLLSGLESGEQAVIQAELIGNKILLQLVTPFLLKALPSEEDAVAVTHHCTASIGIALFTGQPCKADELLQHADTAMYQAKAAGKNALRFFDPTMQTAVAARAKLESDLRSAVSRQEFVLHYQPQVDVLGRVVGVEALVRWQHPQQGLLLPGHFISIAEETGLILPIGHFVLKTACAQLSAWAKQPELAGLTIAVNVSAYQCRSKTFVADTLDLLRQNQARPDRLELELTESLLLDNKEDIIAKMQALKAVGIRFSLDDFGTGYSSLAYLKRLPLNQLKIDKSFVDDILSDPNDAAIARTVIALAQNLDLSVIAEGVETQGQRDFLAQAGCHLYQGYWFSRPLPVQGLEQFVTRSGGNFCLPT